MEQNNNIDNLNNSVGNYDSGEVDFEKYDKLQKEHEQFISMLKDEESKKSSEKIKQLTGELFIEDINLLKSETIPPIEGANSMQTLSESEAIKGIVESLYEISEQKCKVGESDEILIENVSRKTANSMLLDIVNGGKNITPQILKYLYKIMSDDTSLYEEILTKIGGPFILGANERNDRGGKNRGYHMGVDYNLPKGVAVKSIYDGVVVGGRSNNKVFGDKQIIDLFPDTGKRLDEGGGTGNMLIIQHEIGGKTFYSLYMHITDESFSQGQKIFKGQEIGKIDGYDTNGHWQPHLHFTIMNNLDNKNVLHGYGKSEDLKDMVDPSKVYN